MTKFKTSDYPVPTAQEFSPLDEEALFYGEEKGDELRERLTELYEKSTKKAQSSDNAAPQAPKQEPKKAQGPRPPVTPRELDLDWFTLDKQAAPNQLQVDDQIQDDSGQVGQVTEVLPDGSVRVKYQMGDAAEVVYNPATVDQGKIKRAPATASFDGLFED